jgi:hypothetical protein
MLHGKVSLRDLVRAHCEHVEGPRLGIERVVISGYHLPASYLDLLHVANGFVSNRKAFRLFGIDTRMPALDLRLWNRSSWVAEYGDLAASLVFIAEDIFGDQYGLRFASGTDQDPVLVKFWCEGGETEVIEAESLLAWLASSVLREEPTPLDWHLATAAFARGLTPSETEHLSFSVPLVAGGNAEESNLEVMDRVFHLHLLGQLSQKNRSLPEGAKINHFWSES